MAEPTNDAFFDIPANEVIQQIDLMNARADEFQTLAQQSLAALGAVTLPLDGPVPSNYQLPDVHVPPVVAPAGPRINIFGTIPDFADPGFEDLSGDAGISSDLDIKPGAAPTITDPNFPGMPGPLDTSGAPTAPTITPPTFPVPSIPSPPSDPALTQVALPPDPGIVAPPDPVRFPVNLRDSPGVVSPTKPTYLDIVAPTAITIIPPLVPTYDEITTRTFEGITTPTLTDSEPVFDGVVPGPLVYNEPVYNSALLAQTQATLMTMFGGGTGIPTAIQTALFDAARARESETALAVEQEMFDTYAGRGFSMPPGMLVEAVTVAQEKSRFAANGLERDILTKSATWEIDNLRFAVTNGIVLEGQLRNAFEQMAARTFEAAKSHSELEIKVYDVAVALFNAREAARQVNATIYRARWDGEIARVTAWAKEADVAIAKGQLNETKARTYTAQWGGENTKAEVYKTQWAGEGEKVQVNVQKASVYSKEWEGESIKIQAYKGEVEAGQVKNAVNSENVSIYRGKWEGEAVKAGVFKTRTDGALGQAQMNELELRKYVEQWSGLKVAADVFNAQMQGAVGQSNANRATIEAFGAQVTAHAALLNARKQPTEVWVEQMRGEGVKQSVMETRVRAFAETVQAQGTEANTKMKFVELKIAGIRAGIEKYMGILQSQRDHVAVELANINATATAFSADTGRYKAEIDGANQSRMQEVQITEMRLRNNLSYYETQLKEFDAGLNRQIERAKIIVQALDSAGRIGASLAAGAMSAIHVQAHLSAQGQVSSQVSYEHKFPEGT